MPPSILDQFDFDVNYDFGNDSVFTLIDYEATPPFPPILGYFLWLDNTPFTLLDGEFLTLL